MSDHTSGRARVQVTSTHVGADGDRETFEVTTQGLIAQKDDAVYIHYDEPEESGLGDVRTTLRISHDELRVIRFGAVRATQRFVADGNAYAMRYETSHGTLAMEVTTESLSISISDHRICALVQAVVSFGNDATALTMHVEVETL